MNKKPDDTTPVRPDPESGEAGLEGRAAPQAGPAFACDAMLKGLARWLRAFGYDATWSYGIEDAAVVAHARDEGRVLLTSDGGLMQRRAVRLGAPRAFHIPHDTSVGGQLRLVIQTFALQRRRARCMRCGGELRQVPKQSVADEAPPRTFRWLDEFYRCGRCRGLFWRGTHWRRITNTVGRLLDECPGNESVRVSRS